MVRNTWAIVDLDLPELYQYGQDGQQAGSKGSTFSPCVEQF